MAKNKINKKHAAVAAVVAGATALGALYTWSRMKKKDKTAVRKRISGTVNRAVKEVRDGYEKAEGSAKKTGKAKNIGRVASGVKKRASKTIKKAKTRVKKRSK